MNKKVAQNKSSKTDFSSFEEWRSAFLPNMKPQSEDDDRDLDLVNELRHAITAQQQKLQVSKRRTRSAASA